MITINNELCCCCGHCMFIKMNLHLLKTIDRVDYYGGPRPEDVNFVEKIVMDCWASAIKYEH